MELKKGMYVRLNCNYELGIGKAISEIDEDNFIRTKFKGDFECSVPTYMIKKTSYNIIDLIEVGDYVNGMYVEDVLETFVNVATGSNYFQTPTIYENDIKSIVTKEQFESMSYRIGE